MKFGMEVGLGTGDIVLDVDTVPEMTYNVFSGTLNPTHCSLFTVGCGPAPRKGDSLSHFRPMSTVAKRLHASRYHSVRR